MKKPFEKMFFPLLLSFVIVVSAYSQVSEKPLSNVNVNSPLENPEVVILLNRIHLEEPSDLKRDTNGNIDSVALRHSLATDHNLSLVSKLGSVREMILQPRANSKDLTREGFSSLTRLTNLVSLKVQCAGELKREVWDEIWKLDGLHRLGLYYACPPAMEYAGITNLHHLEDLTVKYCSKFGDSELSRLTNLVSLKSLSLEMDGISKQGTNILRSLNNLTNVNIIFAPN